MIAERKSHIERTGHANGDNCLSRPLPCATNTLQRDTHRAYRLTHKIISREQVEPHEQ